MSFKWIILWPAVLEEAPALPIVAGLHSKVMQALEAVLCCISMCDVFAERTKNFSGAEIEGLVKSAASFALNRQVDVNDLSKKVDEDNIKVMQRPFIPIHSASLSSRHKPNLSILQSTDYTYTHVPDWSRSISLQNPLAHGSASNVLNHV